MDYLKFQKTFIDSRRRLRPFCDRRKELIDEYVGHRYGEPKGKEVRQYLPKMAQAADIYTMALAANAPQAHVTTENPALRPFAYRFKQALNRLTERINLKTTLQLAVLDAFFGMGIAKVCLEDGLETEIAPGLWYDTGYPSVKVVSLDDWVHDMQAKSWSQIRFAGHSYEATLDLLKADDRVDRSVLKGVSGRSKYHGDGELRASDLQGVNGAEDIDPTVKLWEIWYVKEQKIYTFLEEENSRDIGKKPLAVMDYTGPEYGPYHFLGYSDVPDCTLPLAPGNNLYELHRLENRLMRKHSNQAGQSKRVIPWQGQAEQDVKRLLASPDGGGFRCDNLDGFQIFQVPGVDPGNFNFQMSTASLFNEAAGNIQALGGLGPMSDTASQDKMINDNVSQSIAKKQARVTTFAAGILRDLGFLMWDHQGLVLPASEKVGPVSIDMTWHPADKPGARRGKFLDYEFSVVPYSMPYQSPTDIINGIKADLNETVLPFLDAISAQGGTFNFQKMLRMLAEYRNRPEMAELIDWAQPLTDRDQAPPQGPSHQRMKPPVTTRNVVRSSRPGNTQKGQAQVMAQLAMGSQGQASQRMGAVMPTGT